IGCVLWKRDRRGGALLIGSSLSLVVIECLSWWPDVARNTPLHLLSRGARTLGPTMLMTAAALAIVAIAAIRRIDAGPASWMEGAWAVLAVPLVAVSAAGFVEMGFNFAEWRDAAHMVIAMPLLVAAVATKTHA